MPRAKSGAEPLDERQFLKGLFLGFILLAVCALIHATSIVLLSEWLLKRWQYFVEHPGARITSITLGLVFALIILIHFAEINIWAITYYSLGLLSDFRTALEFSMGSYTTNGSLGIQLPVAWRLLGQFEAITGALLVGLSTAFLFLLVHKMFDIRHIASQKRK